MISGLEFKRVQDERMQHALLVRPATGGDWRVYIRHYSAHVVCATERALKRDLLRHGWEPSRVLDWPVAQFRTTKRGRALLLS